MGFTPSVSVAFIMLFITMLCWGSWANTLKKCGDWRFESFYWDYAWSIVVWSLLLGIILGGFSASSGWSPFVFIESLANVASSGVTLGMFAGFVWGLGNILLVAAVALSGFAVAFPLALGVALVVGTSLAFVTNPAATSQPEFLFLGLAAVTFAVIANGLAYGAKERTTVKGENLRRGIGVALAAGLLISLFPFPFNYAFQLGVNGYQAALFMTIGGFLAACILLPVLMRRPLVPGQPVIGVSEYKRARKSWHVWAVIAGLVWSIGTVFNLVVAAQPSFSVAVAYTLGQCAPMIAALWGIFVWKEFKSAPKKAYYYLAVMFGLFISGIILLSRAIG